MSGWYGVVFVSVSHYKTRWTWEFCIIRKIQVAAMVGGEMDRWACI